MNPTIVGCVGCMGRHCPYVVLLVDHMGCVCVCVCGCCSGWEYAGTNSLYRVCVVIWIML